MLYKCFDFMSEKMYLGSIEDFLGSDSGILLQMNKDLVKLQLFALHLAKMQHIHDTMTYHIQIACHNVVVGLGRTPYRSAHVCTPCNVIWGWADFSNTRQVPIPPTSNLQTHMCS